MKWFLLVLHIALSGCVSTMKPEIGMSEKAWLRRTLIADIAHIDKDVTVYKSGGAFYYFRDGRLEKVDQGQAATQRLEIKRVDS